VLLREVVEASKAVGATRSRLAKTECIAAVLERLPPEEVAAAVAFLSGELRQRQIGVGWASLRDLPPPAATPTLTVAQVDATFERIGSLVGTGSQGARRAALGELFSRATASEAEFLRRLLAGDLRQGALEGVMVQAVARAVDAAPASVQRAFMLRGDLAAVAAAALGDGPAALDHFRLEVGRPVRPMLARPARDVDEALERLGTAAVEWKLDGARVQVHRRDEEVRVYTRSLDDVTARVPEIVHAALALPVSTAVLDGEAIALQPDGRPEPFQVTGARFARRHDQSAPLTLSLFDVLHADGEDVLDRPGAERAAVLAELVPEAQRTPRAIVSEAPAAQAFLDDAIARGHEGVMLKALDEPYVAGSRGTGWLKVKPVHTLDLVVLAAEWGHGRRRGWLSNLHLGARDQSGGGFVMLGKTFKGLTDTMLAWQTEKLLELETARDQWTVQVRPELVVEIAFDGVQRSSRYPGGVALRFARVLRYREDKTAAEADTLHAVLAAGSGSES
jgi:ATP-dependent DNA ligase I